MKLVSIIIPVHNEELYLPSFLSALFSTIKSIPEMKHVIIVNDGSTDKTAAILEEFSHSGVVSSFLPRMTIITSNKNIGKGAAIRKGFKEAQKLKSDAVIFMDGDGQHNPKHLRMFIKELAKYPVVFGYRELDKHVPFIRKFGNVIARFIIHRIFNIHRIGDILCGFFALRSDAFKSITWYSNDYGVEAEISAIIGRKHIPFKEIKVDTIYLDTSKGVNIFHAMLILLRIPYWILIHR